MSELNLLHSLSVSDEYEMFMRRNHESAEADSEDDSPEPTSEPTPELLQNLHVKT